MPKMKTNRGAASVSVAPGPANTNALLASPAHSDQKSAKRKRQLRGTTIIAAVDTPAVRRMLPYT